MTYRTVRSWSGAEYRTPAYTAPAHHTADVGRTFRPDVCCDHEWEEHYVPGYQFCTVCMATCKRDRDGAIVEYEAPRAARLPELADHGL